MSQPGKAILITDMSLSQPPSALTRKRKRGQWRLMDYQAENVSGTLIGATSWTDAPEVKLPLRAKGWHAVHLGFWNPPFGGDPESTIRLKLTSDPAFMPISDGQGHDSKRSDLKEAFWKCADLTGEELIIAQQSKGLARKAYVAYIKLEPLTDLQVAQLAEDRARTDTRKVIATVDGGSWLENKGSTSREELWEQLELFRHSDVAKVFFAVNYGVTTNYPSKVGVLCAGDGADFDSVHGKRLYDSQHALLDQGLVPYVVALEYAHSLGLEFHVQFRMGLGDGAIQGDTGPGDFAVQHPQWRILHRDGTPLPKLSYAFPQVRTFLLELMREVAQHDIDGVNLGFIRGPQYIGCEKPVVESFMAEHGADPRDLDDTDQRWQQHKAGYLTELVREARGLADEIGRQRGRKLALSAWVERSQPLNLFHGYDVRTWLQEGLLDAIIGAYDLMTLARQTDCQVVFGTGAREPQSYVDRALEGFRRSADHFIVWDIDGPDEYPEHWEILRNLGHQQRVERYAEALPTMKRVKMLNVDGYDFGHTYGRGSPENWPPEMMLFYTNG